jgi:hypothetical protein
MTNPMHRTETSRPAGRPGLRARLAERRADRAARATLERELAGYRSAGDLAELDAILGREGEHDADLTLLVDRVRLAHSR